MHITPTSDIPQPFKSADFDARYQITDTKSERNNMRKSCQQGKGDGRKNFCYHIDVYKPIWPQNLGEKNSLGTLQTTYVEILKIPGYFVHA